MRRRRERIDQKGGTEGKDRCMCEKTATRKECPRGSPGLKRQEPVFIFYIHLLKDP